ncbi:MAG: type II secretion system protein [Candidatus Sumerlaeota bacterium]
MLYRPYIHHRRQRGFYLIGLVAVLAIIMILAYTQLAPDPETGESMPKTQIDRGKENACALNRQTLQTHITAWSVNHVGEKPTIARLKATNVVVPTCPGGGRYSIGDDSTIYCSEHNPDPLATPTPTPTPTPRPKGPDAF